MSDRVLSDWYDICRDMTAVCLTVCCLYTGGAAGPAGSVPAAPGSPGRGRRRRGRGRPPAVPGWTGTGRPSAASPATRTAAHAAGEGRGRRCTERWVQRDGHTGRWTQMEGDGQLWTIGHTGKYRHTVRQADTQVNRQAGKYAARHTAIRR